MHTRDGRDTLLVFNSFSSAFVQFRGELADRIESRLTSRESTELDDELACLAREGIFVPDEADELRRATLLHGALGRADNLHLILMPTEQCNFRCVYCYEDFLRGRMERDVRDGVARLVELEAPKIDSLQVGWFGGEPLAALDVIDELSERMLAACDEHGVDYSANITTNGYLLTEARAARLFAARVSTFQITLDGPAAMHDQLRKLAGGGKTFETIFDNLRGLRDQERIFHTNLRVNYTPESLPQMPEFIELLGEEFGGDPRFHVSFHAVGHWGGPNDDSLVVCDQKTSATQETRLMSLALRAGFGLNAWREVMRPAGSVCYAANPRSFVIGSDGTVYKCTVAFRDERNHVGKLSADGGLNLVQDRFRLWTTSGEETDEGCQQCAFRPACQGNLCPLERLNNNGQKVCPTSKTHFVHHLPVLAAEARHQLV